MGTNDAIVSRMDETTARAQLDLIVEGVQEAFSGLAKVSVLMREFEEHRGWEVLGYRSMAKCLHHRLGFSRAHMYRLIGASAVHERLQAECETIVRQIAPTVQQSLVLRQEVPDERMAEVWQTAVDMAPKTATGVVKVSVAIVRQAAAKVLPIPVADEVPEVMEPEDVEVVVGSPLPDVAPFEAILRVLSAVRRDVLRLAGSSEGMYIRQEPMVQQIADIKRDIRMAMPDAVCDRCEGLRKAECEKCRSQGWLPRGIQ